MGLDVVLLNPWVGSEAVSLTGLSNKAVQDTTLTDKGKNFDHKAGLVQDTGLAKHRMTMSDSSAVSLRVQALVQKDSTHSGPGNAARIIIHSGPMQSSVPPPPPYALEPGKVLSSQDFYPYHSGRPFTVHAKGTHLGAGTLKDSSSSSLLFLQEKPNLHPDWFSIMLILSLMMLAWTRIFFGRYFTQSLQALADFNLSTRLYRDKNVLLQRVSSFLLLNFVLTGALFIYKSLEYFEVNFFNPGLGTYLWIVVVLTIILLFRSFIVRALYFLFTGNNVLLEYHYQVMNFFKSAGIVLIPFVIGISYIKGGTWTWLLWTGFISLMLLYLFRLFKGQRIVKRGEVPAFYLILYLCALEVMPVLIAAKFISNHA